MIPLVDLVITDGGNNTMTESFNFGKPMILLPLFGDQHDHAQRIQDKGFRCSQKELLNAIDKLVYDNELKEKMKGISRRIQHSKSNEKVAQLFEEVLK